MTQSGLPPAHVPAVWAELTLPDGAAGYVDLEPSSPGRLEATFSAGSPGLYRVRVRARGVTRRGMPWERERTATAAVWHGGDRDSDPGRGLVEVLEEREPR